MAEKSISALESPPDPLGLLDDSAKAAEWLRTIEAVAGVTPIVRQIPDVVPWLFKLGHRLVQAIYPSLAPMLRLHRVRDHRQLE